MRLLKHVQNKHRLLWVAMLSLLLAACGGSGGQDPVLGTPPLAISPRVTQTTPARLAPTLAEVATNSRLTATFSRDMLASSINASSFTVTCLVGGPYAGTVTYDAARRLAILNHTTAFSTPTTCEATLSTAITDTAGIPLAKNYVWRFTTGASDTVSPTLLSVRSPSIAAIDVCLTKTVSVTFSEQIDPSTLVAANFYVTASGGAVMPGTITYDTPSRTASFVVTDPPGYAVSTRYTTHVTTGITDLAGLPLSFPLGATSDTAIFDTGTAVCEPVTGVNLRTIAGYGAFGGDAGATNSGLNTVVNGDLGTTAVCTAFTGFHDHLNVYRENTLDVGDVTGEIFCAPPAPGTSEKLAITTQAAADARTAYNDLAALPLTAVIGVLSTGELGARTLVPGIYRPTLATATLSLTAGDLTLDAQGDPNALFVFQIPAELTVEHDRKVLLINGAEAKNVFWRVGTAATLGYGSVMAGTIIANAGVTISTVGQTIQTILTGRAIGLNASVTMVNTTIYVP